jgi:hypothetical protein
MLQLGKDVITNDGSFYSYLIARGILGREGYDRFERDFGSAQPVEGHCTTSSKFSAFPVDVRKYIDGLAQAGNPYLSVVLGKTLVTYYTYRSFGWDKNRMSRATVQELRSQLLKSHQLLRKYVELPRQGRLLAAYNVDWKEFIRVVDVRDAVLFSDFAWPWDPKLGGGAGGPQLYSLYYDIGCILKQQDDDTSHLEVWTVDNVHAKLAEYLKLVADSGRFSTFLLSCQDKDYPPKGDIDALLDLLGFKYDYFEFAVPTGFGSAKGKKSIMVEELWIVHLH